MAKYRKDIIATQTITSPDTGKEMVIDDDYLNTIIANTKELNHQPYIPFDHSLDSRDNTGFMEGFEIADGLLYGIFDIDDEIAAEYIDKGKVKAVSIGIYSRDGIDYIDHVALTVKPLFPDQGNFLEANKQDRIVLLTNNNLKEWGGDTMSEKIEKGTVIGWIKDTLADMKPDAKLTTELEAANTDKVELEAEVVRLKAIEAEHKTLKAEKETADAKVIQLEWDTEWDAGCEAKQVTPGEREIYLGAFSDPEKLKAAIKARPVNKDINLKSAETIDNPSDGNLKLNASEKSEFELLKIDETPENIKYFKEQQGGGE